MNTEQIIYGFYNTKLWKLFKEKTEDDTAFRLSVESVCKRATEISRTIMQFFPKFTIHDGTHIVGVCEWMYDLIGHATAKELTASEVALLVMSASCHDIGMAVDAEQEEALYTQLHTDSKDVIQEYVRKNHHIRVREQLNKYFDNNIWNDSAMSLKGISKDMLADLCQSHGEDLAPKSSNRPELINLNICVVLLRLSDALDYDSNRAPEVLVKFLGLEDPKTPSDKISYIEHKKTGTGKFTYTIGYPIRCIGVCLDNNIYEELSVYIKWLDTELVNCNRFISNYSQKWMGKIPTRVDDNLVKHFESVRNEINPFLRYGFPNMNSIGRAEVIKEVTSKVERQIVVILLGKRHIGKTSVAYQVATNLKGKFAHILYFDFKSDSLPNTMLSLCNALSLLCNHTVGAEELEIAISEVVNKNILFVLDNVEHGISVDSDRVIDSILKLSSGLHDAKIRFILISKKNDTELSKFNCTVTIPGINVDDVKEMAKNENIVIDNAQAGRIINTYGGAPAYIQIAIEYCKSFCNSSIERFLNNQSSVVGSIDKLINAQFKSLSKEEQRILILITVLGNSVDPEILLVYTKANPIRLEKLVGDLYDKNIVSEYGKDTISVFSPINEYLIQEIISIVSSEIRNISPRFLNEYPLFSTISSESAKTHQRNLINRIISNTIVEQGIDQKELILVLKRMLNDNRNLNDYFVGNIINILSEIDTTIDNLDFSNCRITDASMENVEMRNISFRNAIFERCIFKNIFGSVTALSYNDKLDLFATGFFNGLIIIWDKAGVQLSVLMEFENVINDISFDGQFLWACGKEGKIVEWKIDEDLNFEIRSIYQSNKIPVRTIAVSPTNSFAVAGLEDGMVVKLTHNDEGFLQPRTVCSKPYRIKAICLSFDGSLLAVAGDSNAVSLYDLDNNDSLLTTFIVNNRWVRCLKFYNNTTLVCGGDSGNVNIINVEKNECNDIEGVDRNKIWTLSTLNRINCIVTGGNDGTLKIISMDSKDIVGVLSKHSSWVRCIDASDSSIYSGSEDQTICIWNISEYECIRVIKGYTKRVFSLCSANDTIYAGLGDHTVVRLSDIEKDEPIRKIIQCSDQVWTLSASGELLCAGCDKGDVYIYDIREDRVLFSHHYSTGWIGCVSFNQNGSTLAVGDELGNVYLYSTKKKYLIVQSNKYKNHNGRISAILFTSRGVLTIGEDGFLNCSNPHNGHLIFSIKVCNNLLYALCKINDGVYLAGGADGNIYQISIIDQTVRIMINTYIPIWALRVTKKGTIVVGLDNGLLREYSLDGRMIREECNHQNQIWTIEYLDEKEKIVSGGEDSQIIEYDMELNVVSKYSCNRPYDNVIITNCKGLTATQINYLCTMGAIL